MYGFITRLAITEGARRGWFRSPNWVLIEPLIYRKKDGEIINVPAGFVTDLATIPKFLHMIIGPAGPYSKSAVLHDYLLHEDNKKASMIHDLFFEAMVLDGVPGRLAKIMFNAVKTFGKTDVGEVEFKEPQLLGDLNEYKIIRNVGKSSRTYGR